METLTRLVSESLARHGFDRPLDYRRLQWSRWFRCESHHSLLVVPSKPGVFALAEEIMSVGTTTACVGTDPLVRPASEASAVMPEARSLKPEAHVKTEAESRKPKADSTRRMLAVTQFFEDDDMAYVLDRMLSRNHPMHARLESGRYFIRYVEIHDPAQRRSICSALNQWIASSSEKATGIGSHFATSLELTPTIEPVSVGRTLLSANSETGPTEVREPNFNNPANKSAPPEVVADPGIHRSSLFPSGF
ncbi:MAG TPA: hypothetical protein VKB49_01925 [Candidatus Sulfotelmatobacter sp.]|nr:hypothetical protein [Candidatus Sulfotelmatobacter sp.]